MWKALGAAILALITWLGDPVGAWQLWRTHRGAPLKPDKHD
jgi:hypothetical protein